MNELCITSNLTSTELAAWIQALGTIGAVFAAIYISNKQSQKQHLSSIKLLERDKKLALIEQLKSIQALVMNLISLTCNFSDTYPSHIHFLDRVGSYDDDFSAYDLTQVVAILKATSFSSLHALTITRILTVITYSEVIGSDIQNFRIKAPEIDKLEYDKFITFLKETIAEFEVFEEELTSDYSSIQSSL